MRVLVAGATGVIGHPLVPLLTAAGHDVVALTRSMTGRAADAERIGARIVVADALDAAAVRRAVHDARPDAVVNMLTAIPAQLHPRRLGREFALTNRLRTDGTRHLLDAAREAGARRFVGQGIAYVYDPRGAGPANEDAPLWTDPPAAYGAIFGALRETERLTTEAGGVVLRFGHLYGPGTIYALDGSTVRQVRAGKFPIVGEGRSTFSFTHSHDAATAIVAALDKPVTGALNIVDDDPAPVYEWLPRLAEILQAPAPQHIPALLARLAVGPAGVAFMTGLRGADNARARLSLDWRPRYESWRDGFAAELMGDPSAVVR